MNKKHITGVLLLLVCVIALFVIFNTTKPKHVDVYRSISGGSNIQFPYLAAPHSIDFFTGSGFASYNTKTQTSTTISPQFILPIVSEVRWSKTGVLFKASDYTIADDLFPLLVKNQQPIDQEYWWQYTFSDQKLSLILPLKPETEVVDAFWNSSGNNFSYVTSDNSLYLSDNPGRVTSKVISGTRIKQFNGSTITLAEGTVLKQLNTSNHTVHTLINALFQDSYISPDGQSIAYTLNTHPAAKDVVPGDLYKVDSVSKKSSKLLSGFSGIMAGSGGDLYAGYIDFGNNAHLELYPKSGKSTVYSLGSSLNRENSFGNILPESTNAIYIVSKNFNLVEVTTQTLNTPAPINYSYLIKSDLYQNGFEIHYAPSQDTFEIDITKNPFHAYQNAALQYIRERKIDPNQIKIIWRANDGVDKTNSNVATSPTAG